MNLFKRLIPLFGLFLFPLLTACTEADKTTVTAEGTPDQNVERMLVYKSPTCGCCEKWVDHLEGAGFETSIEHPSDLNAIKDRYHIANNLRSCHTAVSSQGYVFEGHIPARYIRQFLSSPPSDAMGLSVPSMPVGSPGMEVGDRFMPYEVLLLNRDGSTEVFVAVESAIQQYDKDGL